MKASNISVPKLVHADASIKNNMQKLQGHRATSQRATEPQSQNQIATELGNQRVNSKRATEQKSQRAREPESQGAREPESQGAREPGSRARA